MSLSTQYTYDSNTGLLKTKTDPNGQETSYSYDSMNRTTGISYPDGGSTTYTYNDSAPNASVVVSDAIILGQDRVQTGIVDGLGRVVQTQLNSDPDAPGNIDYVVTSYDAAGRKASVTNPYRTGEPVYTTQYQYDGLNRVVTLTEQDDNAGHYSYLRHSYSGSTTTVTDEAGNARSTQVDGLGRLVKVIEAPGQLNWETDYTYDSLSNLSSVVQSGSRNRSFQYDSLSRLTDATNPETGHIHYGYDNDGVLISKTDNRGITTNYTPDALHRIVNKSYQNSPTNDPPIYYCYDNQQSNCGTPSVSYGIGRRTGMADASGNTAWSYDVMGRVAEINQTVTGYATGLTYYSYNLDGSTAKVTYPTSDKVQYTYSTAGRVTEVDWTGIGLGQTLASSIHYTAWGAISTYTNGDGVAVSRTYNGRLQPANMQAGSFLSLTYSFNPGHDNGSVASITDNISSSHSKLFTYDAVNRLATASFYGGCNQYTYDNWGNLTAKQAYNGCSGESWSNSVNANNQLNGYPYDTAGNLITVTGYTGSTSTFNAENRWVSTSGGGALASFLYDGDGRRVKLSESGINPETTYYWNGADGNVLVETDQLLHIHNTYFYLNGERIVDAAQYGAAGLYFYYHDDLGNVRVITDNNGNPCFTADYYPWGGIIGNPTNTCAPEYRRFTGKDRDPVMGEDYFGARYYKNDMGRFYSPDWAAGPESVPYAKLEDPQTLNLYTYVRNNPMALRDSDGHEEDPGGSGGAGGADASSADSDADGQVQKPQNQPSAAQSATDSQHVIVPDADPVRSGSVPGHDFKSQEVYYKAFDTDKNGNPSHRDDNHTIELKEKIVGGNGKDVIICNPCKATPKEQGGVLVDGQTVFKGKAYNYDLEKHFMVDGKPVNVYDSNTKASYNTVVVHASYDNGFQFEYFNDSK